jgi:Holliday junction resolvase RusA-like endonuclease
MGEDKTIMAITFTVYGEPIPQGSMRAFLPKGARFPIVTSSNKRLRSWRQELAGAADDACQDYNTPIDREIPLAVVVKCFFKPLKKPRLHKTTKPDGDKLLRAVLDGMTGIVYEDDAQVIDSRVQKFYGNPPRVEVSVGLVEPQ